MSRFVGLCLSLILIISTQAGAGGISTPCGSMYLGNLKVGQQYSLRQLLGFPFNVTYRGRAMVGMKIDIKIPTKLARDGAEPLPDANWIELTKNTFSLDPNQTAETDIMIKIPDNPALMGKKYYVYVFPQTTAAHEKRAGVVFSTALMCELRLDIAANPPTPEEVRRLRKLYLGQQVQFSITPERIFLSPVEVGKTIDLKMDFDEVVKIVNSSEDELVVTAESIPVQRSGFMAPDGYQEADDPQWLMVGSNKLIIQKNTIAELSLKLKLPVTARKDLNYYFMICVNAKSPTKEIKYYIKVYVEPARAVVAESGHPTAQTK